VTTPVPLQITFDGLRRAQLDHRWIDEVGGVEAYVFDGDELVDEQSWRCLRDNLRYVRELGAELLTMHFPTDNADWVNEPDQYDRLRRFCDLAAECGADGVVLHANQFVSLDDWPTFDLLDARKRVVAKVAELDGYLADSPIWIGIENMPIIGSAGVDFDSVFVTPADFDPVLELNSARIGATWDLCHWAVTYSTLRAIAHLGREQSPVGPLDLPALPIRHLHFASFSGHAMPYWQHGCFEGSAPQVGDFDQGLLAKMLAHAIRAATAGTSVVFEVQEEDYQARRNCWRTWQWVAEAPCLDGLVRTGRHS
jgi:sugar phosphate isomerase/epimerase